MKNQKKQEQKQENDRLAEFHKHWIGGMQVVDLESVDEDWTAYESFNRSADISRQLIYGDKAGSTRF